MDNPLPRGVLPPLQVSIAQSFVELLLAQQRPLYQITAETNRMSYSFGYDYFRMEVGDYTYAPIPGPLQVLLREGLESLKAVAKVKNSNPQAYQSCIVSIYQTGGQLEPHVDVDSPKDTSLVNPRDFFFGDEVIGVILEADRDGKFYLLESKSEGPQSYDRNRAIYLDEEAGTVFLLSGPRRRAPFFHGVSPVKGRRISVTYRTVSFLSQNVTAF